MEGKRIGHLKFLRGGAADFFAKIGGNEFDNARIVWLNGTIGVHIDGSVKNIPAVQVVISGNIGSAAGQAKPQRGLGSDYHVPIISLFGKIVLKCRILEAPPVSICP
jgi:hypothetical protein